MENERLYNLLPAIYRNKDTRGELRALMLVIQEQMDKIEEDIDSLYNDWFAETCSDWVLPYIGKLVGITDIKDAKSLISSQRRRIANAVRYQRRKGTPYALENTVADVSGWPAKVIEFQDNICTMQSILDINDKGKTFDFRDQTGFENAGPAFSSAGHFADVRSIKEESVYERRGLYNNSNIGIFVWRLSSYPAYAREACRKMGRRFTFNRAGLDKPLFHRPQKDSYQSLSSSEYDLPVQIRRDFLKSDLLKYQKIRKSSHIAPEYTEYYGPEKSFDIIVQGVSIPPCNIISADLSGSLPADFTKVSGQSDLPFVAVDPELGRLEFCEPYEFKQGDVIVNFHYGACADIGGGPYSRSKTLSSLDEADIAISVSKNLETDTIKKALDIWKYSRMSNPKLKKCTIRIEDNSVYREDISISVPAGSVLILEASNRANPLIKPESGRLNIIGETGDIPARVSINGISIGGPIKLFGTMTLDLKHLSIIFSVPSGKSNRSIEADDNAFELKVNIEKSILWPIFLSSKNAVSLNIKDSIIDAWAGGPAISADIDTLKWGPSTSIESSTVAGKVYLQDIKGSETIFTGPLTVQRRQIGYVRFCYMPYDSKTPAKYRCQPETETDENIRPEFTSFKYGSPGYAQLRSWCAIQIRGGAEDGSEIGVFNHLNQIRREENIKTAVKEYLSPELEAGLFYIN